MTRDQILVAGALLWTVFVVDAISHIATGDWIAPTVAGVIGVAWIGLRRAQFARARRVQSPS